MQKTIDKGIRSYSLQPQSSLQVLNTLNDSNSTKEVRFYSIIPECDK